MRGPGDAVPTVREMFDFVTDPLVTPHNMEACLEALNSSALARGTRRGRGDGGEGASEVGAGQGAGLEMGVGNMGNAGTVHKHGAGGVADDGRAAHLSSTFRLHLECFLSDELGGVSVIQVHKTAQVELRSGGLV